jgi:hypothetical protein
MVSRLAIVLATAVLVAVGSPPALARAADAVVAHDTLIRYIWALDGDVVYWRAGKTAPKRAWMVRFKGHLHRAHGVPRSVASGALGFDPKGRKVFTFAAARFKSGYLVSAKWYVYDLARDRTRPLGGLPPTSCPVGWVSMWRDTMAYTTSCKDLSKNELFLRQGNATRRLPLDPGLLSLTFRYGTLAALWEDGNDNIGVAQYAADGQSCLKTIPASIGDATLETGWFPTDVRIVNGYIVWTMGDLFWRPDFAILAAKVKPGCDTPGPVGVFPFRPATTPLQALAVDNRRVFYADGKTLRKHVLPATPSFDPPPNDNFEHARGLSGNAPLSATGNTAYATVQPGEPLADAKHTVWYAFRPTTSRRFYVTVNPSCSFEPPDVCGGAYRYGVYTGSSPDALTPIPPTHPPSGAPYSSYTRVDAVAGQTYWISVGSSSERN